MFFSRNIRGRNFLFHSSASPSKMIRHRRARFEKLESRAMLTSLSGDFNGDGFDDLAVGAPGENAGAVTSAGAVHIIYGSITGPTSAGNQVFTMESPGINGVGKEGDRFGTALAAGDFNGDGFDDLAIGSPNDDLGTIADAGSVNILYGSATGLIATGDQQFTQNSSGINSVAQANERFGSALAVGDFNGDSIDDLAIGVIGEFVATSQFGGVNILFGSTTGIVNVGDQLFTQETSGIDGVGELNEQFGRALFAGDFNADGRDDLAIGSPFADVAMVPSAGEVNVLYGTKTGLSNSGDQLFRLGFGDILQPISTLNMRFGNALTSGDFNSDGFADLAVGSPSPGAGDGAVSVIYGSANKLSSTNNQLLQAPQALTTPNSGAQFGAAVVAADFDNDGDDDLVVGASALTVGMKTSAGAIVLLKGSASGVTLTGRQVIHQDTTSILGEADFNEAFGNSLTAGRYNRRERFDLAIGVPGEGTFNNIGTVHILFGTTSGLALTNNQQFTVAQDGIGGTIGSDANFGAALA